MARKDENEAAVAEEAAKTTLALNPIVGIQGQDLFAAGANVMQALASQPQLLAKQWMSFAAEFGDIVTSRSDREPEKKDRRFADPAWRTNGVSKALMQSYLAWADKVAETVEKLDLPDKDAARARLVTSIFVDAMAPSNNFFANPEAIKTLYNTGGKSAVEGVKNLVKDMAKNGGLPSSVDASKFKVGENLATTPGNVIFRNEVVELIHYTATTPKVYQKPFILVPPQINKFYSADLSPDKSMVKFLLDNGIQPFCISWRNPTKKMRHWNFQTYIEAIDEAVDAALEITGEDSANMMGSCSGGITLSGYAGWLAAGGESSKINSIILAVCVLNTQAETDNDMVSLVTPDSVKLAKRMSKQRGVLDGQDLAKMFAWMRPNDLIWNYWVNNYLLGNSPPAFDVLYWNADTTRLPAGLHGDFLDMIYTNPFMNPNTLEIGDRKIDMTKVKHDTMVVAGTTDHITPWKAVYETALLWGEDTTFILSNSGHLQSLLNPPGNPKAWYMKAVADKPDAEEWLGGAEKRQGSWWAEWADFLKARSGKEVAAPKEAGSKQHPPLGPAPGTYIFEK